MRNNQGSLDLMVRADYNLQVSRDAQNSASPIDRYNREMAKYTAVLVDDSEEDREIMNNPRLQHSGRLMPTKIVRKALPGRYWGNVLDVLKSKPSMDIPTVDSVRGLEQSLEAVDVTDLKVGNVLCFVSVDLSLGDLNGHAGEGWSYKPTLHVYEVVDTAVKQEFESPFCRVKVRTLQTGHLLQSNILDYTNNEGFISNPLIARGLSVEFSDVHHSGRCPTIPAVQGLYVFRDKRSITGNNMFDSGQGYRGQLQQGQHRNDVLPVNLRTPDYARLKR